jgi:hypothetical protein
LQRCRRIQQHPTGSCISSIKSELSFLGDIVLLYIARIKSPVAPKAFSLTLTLTRLVSTTFRFLEGDLMLHNTEISIRNKQSADPEYIHASSADTSTKAWRRWWAKYGLSATPSNTFDRLREFKTAAAARVGRIHGTVTRNTASWCARQAS